MSKIRTIFETIFILTLLISCGRGQEEKNNHLKQELPKALQEDKLDTRHKRCGDLTEELCNELCNIDKALTSTFKAMLSAGYELRSDSLAPALKKQLITQLQNPITFSNSLDSLAQYLTILTATDRKIKFYSWDDLGGGTWHNINCLAQFKSDKGKIVVQQLNNESLRGNADYTDSGIYEVHELFMNDSYYYLTFASGTHGHGHHHKIVQIFSIISDKLVKCKSCFAQNKDLIIECPRSEKANLVFDAKTSKISYNEFKYNDNIGFFEPTGQIATLKLFNGVFIPE